MPPPVLSISAATSNCTYKQLLTKYPEHDRFQSLAYFIELEKKLRSELEVDADKYIAKWKPIKELRERRATALSTLEIPEIDLQTYISNVKERNKQIELRRKL